MAKKIIAVKLECFENYWDFIVSYIKISNSEKQIIYFCGDLSSDLDDLCEYSM